MAALAAAEGLAPGELAGPPWRARAFGLEVDSELALEGVGAPAGAAPPGAPRLRLAASSGEPHGPVGEALLTRRDDAGRLVASMAALAGGGWLLEAAGFGTFELDAAAEVLRCAPADGPGWLWQRYLFGQALPFAATVRGLEPLHAAGVRVGDRAVLLTGASRAGKTSVALALLARGARLLADDVAALEPAGDGVVVHPGPGLASVRHDAAGLLAGVGPHEVLGDDGEALRVALPAPAGAVPPAGLIVLDRRAPAGERLRVERIPARPSLLLGASFNFVVRTPDRLARQLDACARLAATTPLLAVRIPPGTRPGEVAEAVLEAV